MLVGSSQLQCKLGVSRRSRCRCKVQIRNDIEYEKLKACMVQKVSTKQTLPLSNAWQAGLEKRSVVCFLTHFGDLTTWEYGKKLAQDFSLFEEAGVEVVVVGLGSLENAMAFSKFVSIPLDNLYADETGEGGTLVFEGEKCIWKHVDSGILKYANFETLKQQALSQLPTTV
eukprot:TRINITY_DN31560_c0_g1_i2.p2 TRINITY_DN31560_c0_g1~~TRINITY_DN31560_c0_g1_i2.p2  ORF type:complete len:171 (-),score=30.18 TRINITY_DN31560_c0_g1_i2:528-1040(-)